MPEVSIFDMLDLWDDSALHFDAIKMNVTDSGSLGSSKIIDLQLSGNSILSLRKDGLLTIDGDINGIGGGIDILTGGSAALNIQEINNSVNCISIVPSATGEPARVQSKGIDADVDLVFGTQGFGNFTIERTDTGEPYAKLEGSNFANTSIGHNAAQLSNSNLSNVSIGWNSNLLNTTGSENTAIGSGAFLLNNGGSRNIGIGLNAGSNVSNGSGNIIIGCDIVKTVA